MQKIEFKTKKQKKRSSAKKEKHESINLQLFKRYETFLKNQKILTLNNALKKHYGRHNPIRYKQQYGFKQRWQNNKTKQQEQLSLQFLQYSHHIYYILNLLIIIFKILSIWMLSVFRIFQFDYDNFTKTVVALSIFATLADILIKTYLHNGQQFFKDKDITFCIKFYWKDSLNLLYMSFFYFHIQSQFFLYYIVDVVALFLLYQRCTILYRSIKIQMLTTSYKDYFHLMELFTTLLPITHIFAILIYWVTLLSPNQNWMIVINIIDYNSYSKYIYSMYFAATTMLTVGYGDITPSNIIQIIAILIIQFLGIFVNYSGIIAYGYILNEIGHLISSMRKQKQIVQQNISTISKMSNYYQLQESLVEKAKTYLINKKKQDAQLTPEQQNQLLDCLPQQLRQQISHENSLKILKSSLFFVCNWSKKFQVQVGKKLKKCIFSPNEQIVQALNKEKIYIFKKGKVQLYTNRYNGYKKYFKKLLKVIEPTQTHTVSDNVYGYSFVLSNRPINIAAVSKQFVVSYYIQKKDFFQCVVDDHIDMEYYFEMKSKIDQSFFPQSWEAPAIMNTKQHYRPNIQYIIKKNKKTMNLEKNQRKDTIKRVLAGKKPRRIYYQSVQHFQGVIQKQIQTPDLEFSLSLRQYKEQQKNQIKFYGTTQILNSMRIQSNNNINEIIIDKNNLHAYFQVGKQYKSFFKKSNLSLILQKIQNSNLVLKAKAKITKNHQTNLNYRQK